MKLAINKKLGVVSSIIESIIGIVVLSACIIGFIGAILNMSIISLFTTPEYFVEWINIICYFVIGIEFVKMITRHSVDSVVDVLLVALSRQMIIENVAPINALLIVVAVALLFIIRKYLRVKNLKTYIKIRGI